MEEMDRGKKSGKVFRKKKQEIGWDGRKDGRKGGKRRKKNQKMYQVLDALNHCIARKRL